MADLPATEERDGRAGAAFVHARGRRIDWTQRRSDLAREVTDSSDFSRANPEEAVASERTACAKRPHDFTRPGRQHGADQRLVFACDRSCLVSSMAMTSRTAR